MKKKQIGITYRGLIVMELINEKEIYVNSTELVDEKDDNPFGKVDDIDWN